MDSGSKTMASACGVRCCVVVSLRCRPCDVLCCGCLGWPLLCPGLGDWLGSLMMFFVVLWLALLADGARCCALVLRHIPDLPLLGLSWVRVVYCLASGGGGGRIKCFSGLGSYGLLRANVWACAGRCASRLGGFGVLAFLRLCSVPQGPELEFGLGLGPSLRL